MLRFGTGLASASIALIVATGGCGPSTDRRVSAESAPTVEVAKRPLTATPDPIFVGPEFALPAASSSVATDGTSYLAAWPCGTAICGTRITAAGTFLGPVQELVSGRATPSEVRLASDGSGYMLAWSEGGPVSTIYAVALSREGVQAGSVFTVVSGPKPGDTELCPLDPYSNARYGLSLIYDGTEYSFAWFDSYGDTVVPSSPRGDLWFSIHCPSSGGSTPLAFGPAITASRFGIIPVSILSRYGPWSEGVDLSGRRWLSLPEDVVFSGGYAVSSSGTSHLFAFRIYDRYALVGLALPGDSALLAAVGGDRAERLIRLSYTGYGLVAAYDGLNHVVLWTEGESTYARRVTPAAQFVEDAPQPMPDLRGASAMVSNERGASLLITGTTGRFIVTDIRAAAGDVLAAGQDIIQALSSADLVNAHRRKALANKLSDAAQLVQADSYEDAAVALAGALNKTDGCAHVGAPDANDWITTCAAQQDLYRALAWATELIETKLQPTVAASR